MTDPELALLRREMDRDLRERLMAVEARQDELERRMVVEREEDREVLRGIAASLQRIVEQQGAQAPTLETIQNVVRAGLVVRWLIVTIVGCLAAIGTAATAWEVTQRWMK